MLQSQLYLQKQIQLFTDILYLLGLNKYIHVIYYIIIQVHDI